MDQDDPCKDFAHDAEKRDASVVVTVATLAFVFVEGDDLGIPHVLWSSPFFPALAEDFMQRKQ